MADLQLRDLPVIVTSSLEGVAHVALHRARRRRLPAQAGEPGAAEARVGSSLEKKRLRDQQKELVRRLPPARWPDLQQRLRAGRQALAGTVMFCDIRGFTSVENRSRRKRPSSC